MLRSAAICPGLCRLASRADLSRVAEHQSAKDVAPNWRGGATLAAAGDLLGASRGMAGVRVQQLVFGADGHRLAAGLKRSIDT